MVFNRHIVEGIDMRKSSDITAVPYPQRRFLTGWANTVQPAMTGNRYIVTNRYPPRIHDHSREINPETVTAMFQFTAYQVTVHDGQDLTEHVPRKSHSQVVPIFS